MAAPRLMRPYQYLSSKELLTLLAVSKLMTKEWFVKHSTSLLKMSQMTIGNRGTEFFVKHGVAAVFSAGETVQELRETIDSMRKYVWTMQPFYPIVDFAAEGVEDLSHISDMDNNTSEVISGIIEAGHSSHSAAAVKFTALTGTPLLRKLSSIQSKANAHLHSLGAIATPVDGLFVGSIFPYLAPKGSKLSLLQSHPSVQSLASELSADEKAYTQAFLHRVERIISTGSSSNVPPTQVSILIDAEQTYFQPAVDSLTFDLQRAFNQHKAVIQNTFQCYLRETEEKVPRYLRATREAGVKLGAKLVRGAYMVEEGRLAAQEKVESPIQSSKDRTDACYNSNLNLLISSLSPGDELTIASHNPQSVALGQRLLSEKALNKVSSGVSFAQLMGMKHKLSVQLAQEGYITQKYLPWGPISRLIPYLARRAHESFGIRDQIQEQVGQIKEEIRMRMFSSNKG